MLWEKCECEEEEPWVPYNMADEVAPLFLEKEGTSWNAASIAASSFQNDPIKGEKALEFTGKTGTSPLASSFFR